MIIRAFSRRWQFSLLCLLVLGTPAALAQEAPIKFGKVTVADFIAAPADSAAPAVMLCDFGQSKIVGGREGFHLEFVRTARLLIRRKAGYEWATVDVPLYRNGEQAERLKNLKGSTYNVVNGKLVQEKMADNAIFKENQDKNHLRYRFTLPNVREGSIIEFTYTVESDFLFNLQNWQFQHTIPTHWSEYRTIIPAYFRYKQITRSFLPFAVQEEKAVAYSATFTQRIPGSAISEDYSISTQALSSRWAMQHVPALNEEPYMTAMRDYFSSIEFELSSIQYPNQEPKDVAATWESIAADLLKEEQFGADLKQKPLLAAQLSGLSLRYPDPRERAAAVVAIVQNSLKYNGEERLYFEKTLADAVKRGLGNAAEVNMLLVQSLRATGLEAHPLILSTRSHGHVLESMPVLNNFNYVVAHITLPNNKELLADATEPVVPVGMLPRRCLNGKGRLLKSPTESRWVSLMPQHQQVQLSTSALALQPSGALKGTTHWEWNGYEGTSARMTEPKELVTQLQHQLGDDTTPPSAAQWKNQQDPTRPLQLDLPLVLEGADDKPATLYLTPLLRLGLSTNPFRSESRFFPVDFGVTRDETHQLSITLPAGMAVAEKPQSLTLALPENGGKFYYSCTQEGNKVQFVSRLQLTKVQYSAAEYTALREFYTRIVAKHAEPLVLSTAARP
ncbi:DUF3858 domain-containing protein [Hymenobacter sp. J193]|uniref:DUF3858 domain-containing protein n=1 Tax=Hymenobacter sp. J193 TaxID=2898429 RepID=UPI0021516A74|nr:DUF3858 domain-containing protein [Hymenobacter sp. J193]MCR5887083.1 DUF3858 domain-containing protein [Hymenobacter sp. J193]